MPRKIRYKSILDMSEVLPPSRWARVLGTIGPPILLIIALLMLLLFVYR